MARGPHIVTRPRRGKPVRHYVYAWRGGPQVLVKVGGPKPKITGDLIDAIAKARTESGLVTPTGSIEGLIISYKGSAEFRNLNPKSQKNYAYYLEFVRKKFGSAPLAAFNERRIRSDILEWRDQWLDKPRTADEAVKVLRRILFWAIDRGLLDRNPAAGIKQLWSANHAKDVWSHDDLDAFNKVASPPLQEAAALASLTGLRRGDLVEVQWSDVTADAIIRPTNKSGGKTDAIIPLLDQTLELLDRIKARHAAEMSARPPEKRKDLPATILANEGWQSWTAEGLGSVFGKTKKEAGLTLRLHDLRGTFATRCILAGLSDQETADILGWSAADVSKIRVKYVDRGTIMLALAKRISQGR
ncbi:tyrosine-type recombinase/integrase [Tsuneonella sp. HG249]